MKILVCVKQVPEMDTPIELDEASGTILLEEISEFKMNRLDEFAVEEALCIKEQLPETVIDVITVGPQRSEEVVKRAIGMGADKGVHVLTQDDPDACATATWIAEYARDKTYDLIFTGSMSEDRMQGMVGAMIAAHLTLPCATSVLHEKLIEQNQDISVEREIEGGHRDLVQLKLPAVLSLQSGINRPRYPSLSNLLRANNQELLTIDSKDLSSPLYREKILKIALPQKSRSATVMEGTQQEKAEQLLKILHEKALIQ